jgi:hypothetical protein
MDLRAVKRISPQDRNTLICSRERERVEGRRTTLRSNHRPLTLAATAFRVRALLSFVPAMLWLPCALVLSRAPAMAATADSHEAMVFFENQIRPILANRCYECHGEKKQKSGLRLDSSVAFSKGGEGGLAVVAGKPDESMLIKAVRRTDSDLEMPPDDPLPPAEVALLEKWVAMGAPFPADAPNAHAGAAKDEFGFTAEQRKYWVFQPLAKVTPPAVSTNRWVRNDIDRFVAAKHGELGLQPAPAADRHEFVRRIYFDVHGLPPTRAEIDAFVNDMRPDAFERLVDTLLASPRYGERWAQHWLDLVRYAESDGYRADALRPGAWPYRDYVINSLNADKPYDQFVREQLAGDEIAPENPDVLIATSYLRNPVYEWNQRDVRGQADLIVDDMAANAGEVFLGLSMGCARCHDHKFDPILQKDYFSLRAFFENVLWRTDLKLGTAAEQAQFAEQQTAWETATREIREKIEALVGPALDKNVKRAHSRFTDDIKTMMAKAPTERDPVEQILAVMSERQMQYERDTFDPQKVLKTPAEKAQYKELEAELKQFDQLKPKPLLPAFVATDTGPKVPPTRMKTRKGEREVEPAFLTLLEPQAPTIHALPNSSGRRSALAAWITRPDNPLSTRVIVNRVWQYHFGRGIAGTPNDLGKLGETPTHPELLDWLATRFVSNGWSLKQLHRDILLSAAYGQTARIQPSETALKVDPSNKYLWRFSPRRLDAEQVRDAVLAASGELDLKSVGGASQDANTSVRRSIYSIKKRNNQNELLRAMDAPAGFTGIAERQGTSTPLQALLFMNGDWMITRARKLATQSPSIDAAWEAALGRAPTAEEKRIAAEFLAARADSAAGEPAMIAIAPDAGANLPPGRFHENTAHERVLVRNAPREGDEFTVEAIINADSVDAAAAVRTIASRWSGEKSSLEAHGWSLGITGRKSAHKPLNVIMQLVGEDDNMNTTYEVAASGLILKLNTTYHVVAKVSCSEGTVTFSVRELTTPDGELRTATAKHSIVGKLGTGHATPVIGGIFRRSAHQFDGQIDAVRISSSLHTEDGMQSDPAKWATTGVLVWNAKRPGAPDFEWTGGVAVAESTDPKTRALADLCHVLLNSNEFVYLH